MTSVSTTTDAASATKPTAAAMTRPLVASPANTSRTRAITGRPSLRKTFHTPETRMASVMAGAPKPQDRLIP